MLLNHGVAPVWLVETAAASLHSKVKNFLWNSTGQNKFHLTLVKLKMKLKKNMLNLNQGSRKLLNTNESGSVMWPEKGEHYIAALCCYRHKRVVVVCGFVLFCLDWVGAFQSPKMPKNMKTNKFCRIVKHRRCRRWPRDSSCHSNNYSITVCMGQWGIKSFSQTTGLSHGLKTWRWEGIQTPS